MKISAKFTAILLVTIIVIQSFTTMAFAAEESKFTTQSPYSRNIDSVEQQSDQDSAQFPDTKDSNAQIIAEDPGKRTETSKTFLMNDGSYMLAAYDQPVHYQDEEGEWRDIDNTLSVEDETLTQDAQSDINTESSQTDTNTESSQPEESTVNSQSAIDDGSSQPLINTESPQQETNVESSQPVESAVNSQSFLNDGSFQPVINAEESQAIINNEISQKSGTDEDSQQLGNKAGKLKIKFSQKMKSEKTVTLKNGDYAISWGIDGASKVKSEIIPQKNSEETENHNDQFLKLKTLNNEVLYRDAFSETDVQYYISSNSIKENIILKSKDATKQFTETYQIGDLVAKQVDSKTIQLFEKKDTKFKNPVYAISAPQMLDANGIASDAISISLVHQIEGTLQISIHTDESWLMDTNRSYPVTIDPQVTTPSTASAIRDTFISSGTNYHNVANLNNSMGTMYIGNETANYKLCRILVNFKLPDFNKGDMIVAAQLNLAQRADGMSPSSATMQLNAYEMQSKWDESTVTWDNSSTAVTTALTGPVFDYIIASQATANQYSSWNITKLVKKWYNGTANNGIVVKAADETVAARNVYYASNYPGGEVAYPTLNIYFVNNAGLEDYWSYHSQSAGRAGTGSVNDYTGNLVFTTPIMNTTGERAPLDFSITYNNYSFGTQYEDQLKGDIFGWGWQSNLSQRVDPISEASGTNAIEKAKFKLLADSGYKYIYIDGDGTEHYFKTDEKTSKIMDENGLDIEITSGGTSDEYYTMKYSDGSKKTFTGSGYLSKVYDSEGNKLTLSYYGQYLNGVTDGAGRDTSIAYSGTGAVTEITAPDGKKTKFYYTSGNLTSITYPDSKTIQFTYDSSNQLQKAINVDGTYVQYSYFDSSSPMVKNRVQEAAEYSAAGKIGNKVAFSYNADNTTTFKYYKSGQTDAQQETYNFDNVGRTTSVINMDGSAGTYTYTDATEKSATANKMTSQAATSIPVANILKDHNVELNSGSWTGSNWATPGGVFSVDSTVAYLGTKSLKITQNQTSPQRSGAIQTFTNLTPGTVYTLSGYVKTSGVSGEKGANLYVATFNGSTKLSTIDGKGLFGDNDWQRITVTFTVPANTTRVDVYGGLSYANGTAWFDCLQLETGSVANIYNLLENGDFRYNTNYLPDRWSTTNFTSGDGMSNGKVRLGGNASLNKNIYQSVNINKPANSIAFIVSAKSIGTSVPTNRDGRYYAVDVGTYFSDGTSQWNVVDFNPDANGEQYTSGAVAASDTNQNKIISRVEYYVLYYKNANDSLFSNLQLNMDETGTTYTYDNNGKLVSSKQNAKNKEAYNYSDAKELTSATTSNGATSFSQNYTYTYDTANQHEHRLTAARSTQTGTGLAFGYGTYGNVTNTKMGTVSTAGVLDTSAPYLESTQGYDTNANYVTSSTDQRGKETKYNIDSVTGLTNSVTDPKGISTNYTYNSQSNLLTGIRAQSSAGAIENTYEYDNADRLNKITHNGFDYTFARDGYGNTTIINVGSQNLITNIFASGNGNLLSANYGNGFKLGYFYDAYDRVTSLTKNGATAYLYLYDARGNLAKITDKTSGTDLVTDFSYDIGDRLIKKSSSDGSEIQYSYDNMDRSTVTGYTFSGQKKSTCYIYGDDNRKHDAILLSGRITYEYDSLNREVKTDINPVALQDPTLRTQRSFVNVSGQKTTTLIGTYTNYKHVGATDTILSQYRYTYDDNGNILTTTDKAGNVTTYTYDQLNQLVRADDQKANVSTTYSYDAGGNITATKTYAYTTGTLGTVAGNVDYAYGDTNWKDLLTSYNGQSITYDAIGNPLSYRDGMSFTWEGRQLKTSIANGKNISYTYNSDGIRTSKTVDGVTTKYFLDGSTILAQQTGSDILWFLYDSDGTRVGFTYNDTAYYYTKNAQGDVTGITDSSCNTVVEYSYDAWGKLLSSTDTTTDKIGQKNPFLYRGYYFDSETGLYYLNSRYYDAQTGRFLNADNAIGQVGNIQGDNMFAYCFNNPVSMSDHNANWPTWSTVFTVVAIAAIAVTATALVVATCGAASPALAAIGGAAIGGGSAAFVSGAMAVATGALVTAGVSAGAAVISKSVEDKLKPDHTVYKLVDKGGTTQYVGRTVNPVARQNAHKASPDKANLDFVPIASGLNYYQARGLEQIAMLEYNTLNYKNRINGIGPHNKNIATYMSAGRDVAHYVSNVISDEILYWSGQ